VVDGTTPHCENYGSFATMTVNLGGRQMDVAALHLDWPWPYRQDSQIDAVTAHLEKIGSTALMAGDMNAVPWSHSVARVAKAGGFALMPSPGPSYMALGAPDWLRFAGLPIDQVFAKGDVAVHGVSHLEPVASDHIPVLVEFSLKPGKAPPGGDGQTATARAELAGLDPS
jgi:endonuclease/exonuclease/phosphatase (EEP) superfamily protein YafD